MLLFPVAADVTGAGDGQRHQQDAALDQFLVSRLISSCCSLRQFNAASSELLHVSPVGLNLEIYKSAIVSMDNRVLSIHEE